MGTVFGGTGRGDRVAWWHPRRNVPACPEIRAHGSPRGPLPHGGLPRWPRPSRHTWLRARNGQRERRLSEALAAWEVPGPRPLLACASPLGLGKMMKSGVAMGRPHATDLLGDLGQVSASLPASVSPSAVPDDPDRDFLGLKHLSWLSHLPHSASFSLLRSRDTGLS